MYSKNIDPHTALELIKKARPFVEPNQGFQQQLELFHATRYKISRQDKAIRMFYMGRAVEEVMSAFKLYSGPLAFDPNRYIRGPLQTATARRQKPRCLRSTPARRPTRSRIPLGGRAEGYDARCAGEQLVALLPLRVERRTDRNWRRGSTCWITDSLGLLPRRGLRLRHRADLQHRLDRFRGRTAGVPLSRHVDLHGHHSAPCSAIPSLCLRSMKTMNILQTQSRNPIPQPLQKPLRATHR